MVALAICPRSRHFGSLKFFVTGFFLGIIGEVAEIFTLEPH